MPHLRRHGDRAEDDREHEPRCRRHAVDERRQRLVGQRGAACGTAHRIRGEGERQRDPSRGGADVRDQDDGEQPPEAGPEDLATPMRETARKSSRRAPRPSGSDSDQGEEVVSSPPVREPSARSGMPAARASLPTASGSSPATVRPSGPDERLVTLGDEGCDESPAVGRIDDRDRTGGSPEPGERSYIALSPRSDHDDVVDRLLHLGEQVGAQQDRATLVGEGAQHPPDPADALRVETVDRLVEHEHAGIAQQRRTRARGVAASPSSTRRCGDPRARTCPPARARHPRGLRSMPVAAVRTRR